MRPNHFNWKPPFPMNKQKVATIACGTSVPTYIAWKWYSREHLRLHFHLVGTFPSPDLSETFPRRKRVPPPAHPETLLLNSGRRRLLKIRSAPRQTNCNELRFASDFYRRRGYRKESCREDDFVNSGVFPCRKTRHDSLLNFCSQRKSPILRPQKFKGGN